MGSDWPTVSIGELANITSSKRIFASDYCTSGVPFYRSKEIIEKAKGNSISTELFISRKKFEGIKNKFGAPKANDILLTSVGTLGVPYLVCPNEEFYFKDGNLTWLQTSASDACPRFVYIWLRSGIAKRAIDEVTIGSTQQALTIVALKSLKLNLPPLPEQKAIAHILGSLDDKIELNRRMNATLEGLAQALFKSWFVDFDPVLDNALVTGNPIPEELAERAEVRRQALAAGTANREAAKQFPAAFHLTKELGWIPEGWETEELGKISTELRRGISPKYTEGEGVRVINQRCIRDHLINFSNARWNDLTKKKVEGRHLKTGDLVINSTGVGTLGRMSQVLKLDEPTVVDSHVTVVRPDPERYLPCTFCRMMISIESKVEAMGHGSTGQTELSRSDLTVMQVIVPLYLVQEKAEDLLSEWAAKTKINCTQMTSLSILRDILLPKLISGELRIPDAEKITEEAMA